MYKNIEEMAEYLNYDIEAHNEEKRIIGVFDKETNLYGLQTYDIGNDFIYPKKFTSMGNNKDLVIRYVKGKEND